MYIISDDIKEELRSVIGVLIDDDEFLLKEIKKRKFIVSVGDKITYNIIVRDIKPNIAIVDFRHRRKYIGDKMKETLEMFGDESIEVENPPSTITDNLVKSIEFAFKISKRRRVLIVVKGEEDLASLPAIFIAPEGATVIYGLPDKGVILVDVTVREKDAVRKILERCEEHGN